MSATEPNQGKKRGVVSLPEAAVFLLLVLGLDLYAAWSSDGDFFLPDPFRWLSAWLVVVIAATMILRSERLRSNLRWSLGFAPVALLLGFEIYYRVRENRGDAATMRQTPEDPLMRYTWTAGARTAEEDSLGRPLTISDVGLYDENRSDEKPPGVYRIVVLGDSVPNDANVPFPRRFPKVIESELNRGIPEGRRIEVINVSCVGYNTQQEERMLEKVGLRFHPDLVVLAYVLNDPFMQNGADRRIGNSFFMFRLYPRFLKLVRGSTCGLFRELHEGYMFDLVVRNSMERLRLVAAAEHIPVVVALLPLIEPFDDVDCGYCYDRAAAAAADQGFSVIRVASEMPDRDFRHYLKESDPSDVTHPNSAGHAAIGAIIARHLRPLVFGDRTP